jgi:arylsulfatase A-like enzyme
VTGPLWPSIERCLQGDEAKHPFCRQQTNETHVFGMVGLPGAEIGMHEEDPTIVALLKDRGYATGQFGKNHLGDRDEHLPTNHGFDEFFGNLYHLNAQEEPENEDYPQKSRVSKEIRPSGRHPFLGPRGWHPKDRGHRTTDQKTYGNRG